MRRTIKIFAFGLDISCFDWKPLRMLEACMLMVDEVGSIKAPSYLV